MIDISFALTGVEFKLFPADLRLQSFQNRSTFPIISLWSSDTHTHFLSSRLHVNFVGVRFSWLLDSHTRPIRFYTWTVARLKPFSSGGGLGFPLVNVYARFPVVICFHCSSCSGEGLVLFPVSLSLPVSFLSSLMVICSCIAGIFLIMSAFCETVSFSVLDFRLCNVFAILLNTGLEENHLIGFWRLRVFRPFSIWFHRSFGFSVKKKCLFQMIWLFFRTFSVLTATGPIHLTFPVSLSPILPSRGNTVHVDVSRKSLIIIWSCDKLIALFPDRVRLFFFFIESRVSFAWYLFVCKMMTLQLCLSCLVSRF